MPGGRRFGPYLGGLRVRLAVSALNRVLPLAYAADGLRGAAREMARVRGVGPAGRAGLVAALVAVLERDRAAIASVRAELVQRRDAAAGVLAFELAARLREEIEALDWVTAEQKVSSCVPTDADAYGWAGGVLVHFEVRAGFLRAWTQRACSPARARPLVSATPAAWAAFAQRGADLAARLLPPG